MSCAELKQLTQTMVMSDHNEDFKWIKIPLAI